MPSTLPTNTVLHISSLFQLLSVDYSMVNSTTLVERKTHAHKYLAAQKQCVSAAVNWFQQSSQGKAGKRETQMHTYSLLHRSSAQKQCTEAVHRSSAIQLLSIGCSTVVGTRLVEGETHTHKDCAAPTAAL